MYIGCSELIPNKNRLKSEIMTNKVGKPEVEKKSSKISTTPPICDCDKYSSNPNDLQKVGNGINFNKIDPYLAIYACKKALEKYPETPRFLYQLARAYFKNQEGKKALKFYLRAAEKGHTLSQTLVGMFYEKGELVEQNYLKAKFWYEKSAKHGEPCAQYNLGLLFENGQGVALDYPKAAKLYKSAYRKGHKGAIKQLGRMYELGIAVNKDIERAKELYVKSGFLPEKGSIYPQTGHTLEAYCADYSPDGKFIVSGGWDQVIKLWDSKKMREIKTLRGHTKRVYCVKFSPDGNYIISGGEDMKVILWSVLTGKELHSLSGHTAEVKSVAFSSDGKYVASGSAKKDGYIIIWDLKTGKQIKKIGPLSDDINSLAFSKDTSIIISGGRGGLTSWSLKSSNKIWQKHTGATVFSIKILTGNKYILVAHGHKVSLLDFYTGTIIREYKEHPWDVLSVDCSADGKYAISGGFGYIMKLWDITKENEIKNFKLNTEGAHFVKFSPNGKHAISGGYDRTIQMWDVHSGKEVGKLMGNVDWFNSVKISSNNRYLFTASGSPEISMWDVSNGRLKTKLEGHKSYVTSFVLSKNDRNALSGSGSGSVILWDLMSEGILRSWKAHDVPISSIALSPNGKMAVTVTFKGKINDRLKIWDIPSGKYLGTLKNNPLDGFGGYTCVKFSPDGSLICGKGARTVNIWDIASKNLVFMELSDSLGQAISFTPDTKNILFANGNKLRLFDLSTNELVKEFIGHKSKVSSIDISIDGHYAISGSSDNSAIIWDIHSGDSRKILKGHSSRVYSVGLSLSQNIAFTSSLDGLTKIWKISTEEEICSLISFYDGEWIIHITEGYFNSSQNGANYLNARLGNNVYGIEQFYDIFFRPDIVRGKLHEEDINELINLTIDDAITTPPPSVEFISVPKNSYQNNIKIKYRVKSTGGGIGEIRVYQNGKLIKSVELHKENIDLVKGKSLSEMNTKCILENQRAIVLSQKLHGRTNQSDHTFINTIPKKDVFDDVVEIEPISGDNEISIVAFNEFNSIRCMPKTTKFTSKLKSKPSKLYILSIGIDRYKDSTINLSFAKKDAQSIGNKIVEKSLSLYHKSDIIVKTLYNEQTTKINIIRTLDQLSKVINPNDQFIMFVASHGALIGSQYYLITHDYNGRFNENHLISSNEIVEISKRIKALCHLFIFDTCHAGGVNYVISSLYDARMSVFAKKMGLHIYASANSFQHALDGYKGNGLFTHSILKGLDDNLTADKDKNQTVSIVELGHFSKKNTEKVAKSLNFNQTPLIINFGQDKPIYQYYFDYQHPQFGKIKKSHHDKGDFVFLAEKGGVTDINEPIKATKTGRLIIETNDVPQMKISIYNNNGQKVYQGKGNSAINNFLPGKYTVMATASGHVDKKKSVYVSAGRQALVRFILEPLKRRIFVNANPPDSRIRILHMRPKFQQGMLLTPGRYELEASHPDCYQLKKWVFLNANEDLTVEMKLQSKYSITVNQKVIKQSSYQPKKFTNQFGMRFVLVKAGSFLMGSPESEEVRDGDEKQHRVTLTKNFYMQTTEITHGQWKSLMGNNPSYFKKCGDDCPVEMISWNDVQKFIKKLNQRDNKSSYRLPTEAEWEYAARAGTTTQFFWGNQAVCSQANYGNSDWSSQCQSINPGQTKSVMSYSPNVWGLYDMHGNVDEWCQDYDSDYPEKSVIDPTGPRFGEMRVTRGGSWYVSAGSCRSADRYSSKPSERIFTLGARLVAFQVQQGK